MKAVALSAIETLNIIEVAEPKPILAHEVLIRVKAIGVCGSDMHYFRTGKIGSQVVQFPFLLGHEFAGEILQVGKDVTAFKAGDRVAVDPAMPCLECDQCKSGREHTCRTLDFLGCPGQVEGCMKERIAMPAHCCFLLPENLSFEDGMLCEPFSIGIYAVNSFGSVAGKEAGIIGFGPIGMSVLSALKAKGVASTLVSEKLDYRLKTAASFGATHVVNPTKQSLTDRSKAIYPNQLDVVFECCGQQDAVLQAIEMLKPGGTLMIIGIPEFDTWHLPVDTLRRKEITLKNVRRQNGCMQEAIDLLNGECGDLKSMITHRYNYAQSQEAYNVVAAYDDKVMKAVVEF